VAAQFDDHFVAAKSLYMAAGQFVRHQANQRTEPVAVRDDRLDTGLRGRLVPTERARMDGPVQMDAEFRMGLGDTSDRVANAGCDCFAGAFG
jgi:hypothetical protein